MRIITGRLKGRTFKTPNGYRTHPMGDRIKVALFNTIAAEIPGARVLDAYAGSGALGFEALSRGAEFVQLVEKDGRAYRVLRDNVEAIGVNESECKATRANISSWLKQDKDAMFDIIFADPPFDELNLSTIKELTHHLTPEGLMVLSHSGREAVPTVSTGVVVVDNRMYGEAALSYYRKEQ